MTLFLCQNEEETKGVCDGYKKAAAEQGKVRINPDEYKAAVGFLQDRIEDLVKHAAQFAAKHKDLQESKKNYAGDSASKKKLQGSQTRLENQHKKVGEWIKFYKEDIKNFGKDVDEQFRAKMTSAKKAFANQVRKQHDKDAECGDLNAAMHNTEVEIKKVLISFHHKRIQSMSFVL